MNKRTTVFITLLLLLVMTTGIALAQERGKIFGAVYQDVNGDGVCVDSGVEGENPVADIDIEFVSSDEEVVITLQTGADGTFGLVAAGQSIWRVTAKPDPREWVVTSQNPQYPAVLPETGLTQTDVNFCIQKGGKVGTGNAVIVLPESGAPGSSFTWLYVVTAVGISSLAIGIFLEWRRRQAI